MNKNRLAYLDALRGIAVLTVLIHHILGYFNKQFPSHPLSAYIDFLWSNSIDWGRYGVALFFLISGFIIPKSLKPNSTIKRFVISRFFRLYPAFWATILLLIIVAPYFPVPKYFSLEQILANITMIPKLFGFSYMSGVFWTLFIELTFYFCCAFIFKFKALDNPVFTGLAAIGLLLITPSSILVSKYLAINAPIQYTTYHLSFLFFGNLLRLSIDNNIKAIRLSLLFGLLACASLPIVTGFSFHVPEAIQKGFVTSTPHSAMAAYLFSTITFIYCINNKALNNKVMIELGNVSYSLYLIHMPCIILVAKLLSPETAASFFAYAIASGILAYSIAKLSFQFIETPAIRFGRNIK